MRINIYGSGGGSYSVENYDERKSMGRIWSAKDILTEKEYIQFVCGDRQVFKLSKARIERLKVLINSYNESNNPKTESPHTG